MNLFKAFFNSEKSGGFILIFSTLIAIVIANSAPGEDFLHLIHSHLDLSFGPVLLDLSIEHWVNDGLMAIFFLLVGLEIERELYVGELSTIRNAMLPILAAIGGMLVPAGIHLVLNAGTETQAGFGIPMATDIAFALGILSLAGNRVPVSLKIFLTALAIIDDLGAITVIAIFYTEDLQIGYLLASLGIFAILFIMGKLKVYKLVFYLLPGLIMWYCMLQSGIHATIAGVLLAFAIPFNKKSDKNSSYYLQHVLHKPVAFIILPLFALVNTAIPIPADALEGLGSNNALGIILGLIAGKFAGIMLAVWLALKAGIANKSEGMSWRLISGVSILAGIGFTMSIFITNLAFNDTAIIISSKLAILLASLIAAVLGLAILFGAKKTTSM
ncbi:MAG: Na+/H+ antiporter NhaA [Flavisolibacter sp.]